MHNRLNALYACECDRCKFDRKINLASGADNPLFKGVLNAAEKAFKYMFKMGGYDAENINEKPYQKLIDETYKVFNSTLKNNDIPDKMLTALQSDAFLFGGLKAHAQLLELSTLLYEDGKIKPFYKFEQDYKKVNTDYNQNYLEAEYQFAVNSSQMAANWSNLDDTGRYFLQYRTANDDRVREAHAALQDITLPKDDPFWVSYYPPNGWRCRCQAVEVRKSKYEESDSDRAVELGKSATSQIGKDGKNRLEMFRFNPGKEEKLFPPKHPYTKVKKAKEVVEKVKELSNVKDLSQHFESFAKDNPEFFQRGFTKINHERSRRRNGSTDMNGEISLRKEIVEKINDGLNHIRNKKATTYEHEKAFSTLHHELWHNANKKGMVRLTKDQILNMEMANEFVARKTLPDFMKKIGGKLHHPELMETRSNTGYNSMVVNYDSLIAWSKANPKKVLNRVRTSLIEESYTNQREALVKAIAENSPYKLSDGTISSLFSHAKKYNPEQFSQILENNKEKLLK
ncbi:MAG: phage minor head protein [Weeksellaceae bacterium]